MFLEPENAERTRNGNYKVEKDYEEAVERVIEDVLRLNITGNYVRVVEGETTKKKEENL